MGRRALLPVQIALYALAALCIGASGYAYAQLERTLASVLVVIGPVSACICLVAAEYLRRLPVEPKGAVEPLTGLPRRGRLLADLEKAVAQAKTDRPQLLVLLDLIGFKDYNDTFGRPAGDALLKRLARKLSRVVASRGTAYRLDGDEFAALVPVEDDAGQLADLIATSLVEEGDGFAVAPCYGTAVIPHEAMTASDALRIANERMYALKYSLRPTAGSRPSNEVLMEALDTRSPDRGDHVHGLAEIVESVARRLGVGIEELEQVRLAAELHDVGKTALPSSLLGKRFPLDPDEREFVERHTLIGERILRAAPALARVARLVRWTHERYDGAGYPDRLSGEEIPLGARIIAVCDAFDAMISARPYRKALSVEQAVAELRHNAGSQFDPIVVEAFCTVMEERERFFLVA
jgi:two-component system cell cycle response regulator